MSKHLLKYYFFNTILLLGVMLAKQSFGQDQSAKQGSVTNPNIVTQILKNTPSKESAQQMANKMFFNDKLVVSNVFPNPSNESAEIQFTISSSVNEAKITFFSILGMPIKTILLNKEDKKVRIQTKEMQNGIYLYQLIVDGKTLATKKLFVKH
ncbi:MAG: T9SS type A sorting domain-containing protein [Pseudarcicella sp.]|nr:T9SS type A sorting domain-containing protein [Pseudarcicella sp.]